MAGAADCETLICCWVQLPLFTLFVTDVCLFDVVSICVPEWSSKRKPVPVFVSVCMCDPWMDRKQWAPKGMVFAERAQIVSREEEWAMLLALATVAQHQSHKLSFLCAVAVVVNPCLCPFAESSAVLIRQSIALILKKMPSSLCHVIVDFRSDVLSTSSNS